jgi:PilZ domain
MQAIEKPTAIAMRRSLRIPKEVAILLIGSDARGKEFMEQTKTVVLSRHGAGIVSRHRLGAEQELIVIREECKREAEIRVVGEFGSEDGLYTYGVAFLDPDIDFWGVEFGSPTDAGASEPCMVLQCNMCGRREAISPDALESEIYAVHDGLLRDCKQCHRSTLWKRTSGEVPGNVDTPEAVAVSAELAPPLEPVLPPAASKNRRKHMRIKVNFTGCVRHDGFEQDIVVCENISLGGLCFKSSRFYQKTTAIEVTAPYTHGSPDIPVSARIVHVMELPEEKMFRYGAQYLHPGKDGHSSTLLSAL